MRRLVALAGLPAGRVATAVALSALTLLFGVGLLATSGYLISRAAEQPPILALTTAIVAVRFFGLARPLARYAERLVTHDLALRSLGRIRSTVVARLEPLAPAALAPYRRGDLLGRFVADVDALQGLVLRGVVPPAAALVAVLVCVAVAAWLLPAAAIVLTIGLAVGAVAVPAVTAALDRRVADGEAEQRGALTADVLEVLRLAPELAANGRERETLEAVGRRDRALTRLERRDAIAVGLGDALGTLVSGLTTIAVLAAAVAARSDGALDPLLVATLALLALAAFEAVSPLPAAARELTAVRAAGRRVLDLLDRRPAAIEPERPLDAPRRTDALELRDAVARYPAAARPSLEGLTLRLAPGDRVALVGPSGAGKTTAVAVLLRFLDAEAGTVTVAGTDVRLHRQDDVRGLVALAGQEAHLFATTIRENLLLADPAADDDRLYAALRQAQLDDWVASLPEGLETPVGEWGAALSGGQRQRLVIARALLADRPVLVLDEPTAHLDAPTAERLIDDVLDAAGDRAVLLVTHRPEGVDRMHTIVRLDGGRSVPSRSR